MRSEHDRPGFTLVEALLAVVVSAVLFAAVYRTVIMQQRSYRQQTAMVGSRQTTRTSLDLLAVELRDASASGGDLLLATRDSLTFRAFRKMGVACNVTSGSSIDVWELGEPFAKDDSVFVFEDGDTLTKSDDRWIHGGVSGGVSEGSMSSGRCEDWTGVPIRTLSSSVISSSDVRVGAPVRAYETLTYGIYRFDDDWMLGRHAVGKLPVALVGPLAPPTENGLRFSYFDGNGNELTPTDAATRERVERVQIQVRGIGTGAADTVFESLVTQVHFRGNAWN